VRVLSPCDQYETSNYCHHFTGEDHRELGRDLGIVFYKWLIPNEKNDAENVNIQKRFLHMLHGRQLNVQSD
jgi:hypothetical protein